MASKNSKPPVLSILPPLEEIEMRLIPEIDSAAPRRASNRYLIYWRGRPWPLGKGAFNGKGRASTVLNEHVEWVLKELYPYTGPAYPDDRYAAAMTRYRDEIDTAARAVIQRLKESGILTIEPMRWPNSPEA